MSDTDLSKLPEFRISREAISGTNSFYVGRIPGGKAIHFLVPATGSEDYRLAKMFASTPVLLDALKTLTDSAMHRNPEIKLVDAITKAILAIKKATE